MKIKNKISVRYRTLYLPRRQTKIALEEAIEKFLDFIGKYITFYTRARKYGTVEVRFTWEEVTWKHFIESLRTAEWLLLPTYLRKHISRGRISRVLPETKELWLVAAVLMGTKEEARVLQATRAQQTISKVTVLTQTWEGIILARESGGYAGVYSICDNLPPNCRTLLQVVEEQVGTVPIPIFVEGETTSICC